MINVVLEVDVCNYPYYLYYAIGIICMVINVLLYDRDILEWLVHLLNVETLFYMLSVIRLFCDQMKR